MNVEDLNPAEKKKRFLIIMAFIAAVYWLRGKVISGGRAAWSAAESG